MTPALPLWCHWARGGAGGAVRRGSALLAVPAALGGVLVPMAAAQAPAGQMQAATPTPTPAATPAPDTPAPAAAPRAASAAVSAEDLRLRSLIPDSAVSAPDAWARAAPDAAAAAPANPAQPDTTLPAAAPPAATLPAASQPALAPAPAIGPAPASAQGAAEAALPPAGAAAPGPAPGAAAAAVAPDAAPAAPAPLSTPPAETLPAETLSATSPLSASADFTLDWPDIAASLPDLPHVAPDPDAAPALAEATSQLPQLPARGGAAGNGAGSAAGGREAAGRAGASVPVAGGRVVLAYPAGAASFAQASAFEARFRSLSALQTLPGKDQDTLAQMAVRAASDRQLLEKLLKVYGYYDGEVLQTIGGNQLVADSAAPAAGGITVRFDISPGTRYRLGTLDLGQLTATGADYPALRQSFALSSGDFLSSDAILVEIDHLTKALGEAGYPFAKVDAPALTIDHARELGDLRLPVSPNGKYAYGAITSNLPRFMSARHIRTIARFKPGQVYKASEVDDLRRALLGTGLLSGLKVTPRALTAPTPDQPGVAALDITMSKAPLHTIAGAIGYDTGEGYRLEASWENRNLLPPEGALKLRGIAGTDEQLAGITFRRNNFGGRDRAFSIDLYADNATLDAYAARKVALAVTYQQLTTALFQKPWTWSAGIEAEASDEREGLTSGITTGRRPYYTLALPLRGAFDGSNNLLDPSRGGRVALKISPEINETQGTISHYLRAELTSSWYLPVTKGVVWANRVRLGSILGTELENIAPSRRYYAGGGGSIRGFGYMLVGPRNALGDPMGGRAVYEVSNELRIDTGWLGGNLQIVPFIDMGGVDTGTVPGFQNLRYGAGFGLRYRSGFGPIRVDIGTPINPQPGDSRIGVYLALGQSF